MPDIPPAYMPEGMSKRAFWFWVVGAVVAFVATLFVGCCVRKPGPFVVLGLLEVAAVAIYLYAFKHTSV